MFEERRDGAPHLRSLELGEIRVLRQDSDHSDGPIRVDLRLAHHQRARMGSRRPVNLPRAVADMVRTSAAELTFVSQLGLPAPGLAHLA